MKDWDYANLTKTASEHGGPQRYIDEVADTNFSLGFNHGHDSGVKEGSIGTAVILGGIFLLYKGGKWIVNKIKETRAHDRENEKLKSKSEKAKQEFIAAMENDNNDEA